MAAKREPNQVSVVPAGFEIKYWGSIGVDGKGQQRRYAIDDDRVPSFSALKGTLHNEGLLYYCEKRTVEGTLEALGTNGLPPDPVDAIEELRRLKLDWRSSDAAERGTAVHDQIIGYIYEDRIPSPEDYPEEWRPYIEAGLAWYQDTKPVVLDAERMVGSKRHGFAGRFDLLLELKDRSVARVDLKTTKKSYTSAGKLRAPYPEWAIQLAAYELAAVESGYAASDLHQIVRLFPDGDYDVSETFGEPEDVLALVDIYYRLSDLRKRKERA